MQYIQIIIIFILITACAGPSTPFGSDVLISKEYKVETQDISNVQINTYPTKQYYNSPFDLTIKIKDKDFDITKVKYEILYNNKKINRWFKTEEIIIPQNKKDEFFIHFKGISIRPGNKNEITFLYYPKNQKLPIAYKFGTPTCKISFNKTVNNTSPFRVPASLKNTINTKAQEYNYNPSLVAALIAQESSFNSRSLSFSRALGLTQITPIAHEEINKIKNQWRIYPDFEELPYLNLKAKIFARKINSKNDWRLDNSKAVEGGMLYLDYLQSYWSKESKNELLKSQFADNIPMTDILLASYNSGAARVRRAIERKGNDWLFDKKLNEARKYVRNINSYCYSFNEETSHEK